MLLQELTDKESCYYLTGIAISRMYYSPARVTRRQTELYVLFITEDNINRQVYYCVKCPTALLCRRANLLIERIPPTAKAGLVLGPLRLSVRQNFWGA